MNKFKALIEKPWFKPIRNAGKLSMGRVAQGAFSIAYTALAARALGIDGFGTLVLIHSFVLAVSQLARFQSWQILLQYGAQNLHDRNTNQFQQTLKFSLFLDFLSSLIALTIILVAIEPASKLFGLPSEHIDMAKLYGIGVVFVNLGSAPNGVLRLLDRFDLVSIQTAIEPFVRLVGAIVLYFISAGLSAFLILWFLSLVAGKIVLNIMAWRELKRQKLLKTFSWSITDIKSPDKDAWSFAITTNIGSSLSLAGTQLPIIAVGMLLGPAAAGLFKTAQQFANVLTRPTSKLLVPAIYPALAHLSASGDHDARRKMAVKNSFLMGGLAIAIFIILVLFGKILITLVYGSGFVAAYPVMLLLALAGAIEVMGFSLEPLLVSAGKATAMLKIRALSTATYIAVLYAAVTYAGLVGAGAATIAYILTSITLLFFATRHLTKKSV